MGSWYSWIAGWFLPFSNFCLIPLAWPLVVYGLYMLFTFGLTSQSFFEFDSVADSFSEWTEVVTFFLYLGALSSMLSDKRRTKRINKQWWNWNFYVKVEKFIKDSNRIESCKCSALIPLNACTAHSFSCFIQTFVSL